MKAVSNPDARPAFPAAYAAFTPVLERLSDSLVELLHGQLLQFERFFARSFDTREFAPQGEFEGLGGLTMHGDIAHIVQSELLLRTEAPLEFLRRLAESETLYLEKQFADPGARPVFRAMVSVGPGLLGHGRLVALAALFFMARIAQARGAEFHWCFLPRADGAVWFDQMSVNTIKRFLRASSYREMGAEDVAAAQRLWESLEPDLLAADAEYLDWTIGAAPRGSVRPFAFKESANTLAFALLPPVRGEQRAAQFVVRQRGAERTRATILFPDDRICVSALSNPFEPLKPADLPKLATGPKPKMDGWEPLYFISPRTDTKIVRMPHGLLIFTIDAAGAPAGCWFVLLPRHVKLAGVDLEQKLLRIAVHTARSGRDTMVRKEIVLAEEGKCSNIGETKVEITSAHLFKHQRPFAIPTMSWGKHVEVYSTFGQAFAFQPRGPGEPVQFTMLHKAPKTLWSNGVYRVVRDQPDASMLRVVRHVDRRAAEFFTGSDEIGRDRLFGLLYSPAQRSLAYSISPNVWVVPSHFSRAAGGAEREAGTLRLEPHETLLAAHGDPQYLVARIWSDARHGGDGTVRTMRYDNGVPTLKQPVLKLGEDALSIVKVQPGDDGIWALKVDDDQQPSELLVYRKKKKLARSECTRFDLRALVKQAIKIDLGPLGD